MAAKNAKNSENCGDALARELAAPVGNELAALVDQDGLEVTADMTRREAVARAAVVRAMKGDHAAVKMIFEMERRRKEKEAEIPFIVEHMVVDDEI